MSYCGGSTKSMKILMINSVCGVKSTGRICTDLAVQLKKRGHTVRIAYGRGSVPDKFALISFRIGNDLDVNLHGCHARIFDDSGFGSKKATKDFISWVEKYDPDVIHLHNIHGYYLNIQILFDYLQHAKKRIVWTLHDCWPFTGHCCYFDFAKCDKWREQCHHCPQKKDYPASIFFDHSHENQKKKKECLHQKIQFLAVHLLVEVYILREVVHTFYIVGQTVAMLLIWNIEI